jgi:ABC-type oligopeptide transport system substrate-binding subunit
MNKILKITPTLFLLLAIILAACGPTATQLPSEPEVDQELPPPQTLEPTATPQPIEPTATAVPPTAVPTVMQATAARGVAC